MESASTEPIMEVARAINSFLQQTDAKFSRWIEQKPDHIPTVEMDFLKAGLKELYDGLTAGRKRLTGKNLNIAFGGVFSSGKSTIINRLLDWKSLPTFDLEETGIACLIEKGEDNSAEVWTKDGKLKEKINEFTKDDLQKIISLSEDIHKERNLEDIHYVKLKMRTTVIPENITWIDSPGIKRVQGPPSASEIRAKEIAKNSDMLVWVTSGKNPWLLTEEPFLTEHITGNYPAPVLCLYNVYKESELSDEEWNTVFNEDYFENETNIRKFFDRYPKALYRNIIHRFSAKESSRLDNDSYFSRFCRELNKLDSPHRAWISVYRMKKLAFSIADLEEKLANLMYDIEKKRLDRMDVLKKNVDSTVSAINTAITAIFDKMISELKKSREYRVAHFDFYYNSSQTNSNLAEDIKPIGDILSGFKDLIVDILKKHLFPHKSREWIESHKLLKGKELFSLGNPIKITTRITAVTKNKIDLDAIGDNISDAIDFFGEWVKDKWEGTNKASKPSYNDTEKLDLEESERLSKINIREGYTEIIGLLESQKTERIQMDKMKELDKLAALIIADYDQENDELLLLQKSMKTIYDLSVKHAQLTSL